MSDEPQVLDEKIIATTRHTITYRRWLKGQHPHLGVLHRGWSGWETIVEYTIFDGVKKFSCSGGPPADGSS